MKNKKLWVAITVIVCLLWGINAVLGILTGIISDVIISVIFFALTCISGANVIRGCKS